jgi:hypothetical protein
MDQNSTNGTGTDKRNWRERLGIGAKELPKLSDEFRSEPPLQTPAAGSAKPAPRPPQPVTKPAPMAPRAPAAPRPQAAEQEQPSRIQRAQENGPQDALADKLRAQRAAAEKLAEQRVQAARDRAESKASGTEPTLSLPPRSQTPSPQPKPTQQSAAPSTTAAVRPSPSLPPGRPKFSFAEDDSSLSRKEPRVADQQLAPPRPALSNTPPLIPPRPALGGDRAQPPFLRPSVNTGARTQPPPYRPIDPATGYTAPPRPAAPPPPPIRSYSTEPPAYGATRPPVRRPLAEPFARPAESRGFASEEFEDESRSAPRLNRPPVQRGRTVAPRPPEEDYEEVFEDEPAPRQRASARDYQNAYRETEGIYEEDKPRSSGPWLLLLGLLALAFVTAGVVWFYNSKMRTVATPGAATSDSVPVVTAPEQPVKTAPELPVNTLGESPAVKKKEIYDRIVGDQEVTNDQVMPTEEIPVEPAAVQPPPGGTVLPDAGAAAGSQIPVPDVPAGNQTSPSADEPAPLPLPPPPGIDTQGSLDQSGIEKIAAAAAQPEQGSSPPPAIAAPQPLSSAANLPPPETTTDGAVVAADTPTANSTTEADPAPPPVKKKDTSTKQASSSAKKKVAAAQEASGEQTGAIEPVILVPPSQPAAPSQGSETASTQQDGSEAAPVKKKKTLFDLFRGSDTAENAAAQPAAPAENTQVASLPDAKKPEAPAESAAAPETTTAAVGGYVVQLASFPSEAEAKTEYGRLSSLYPTVVGGVPSRINQATVGGSSRYQLGLGPLASRSEATRVCSALFSAGERDCIVRSQ